MLAALNPIRPSALPPAHQPQQGTDASKAAAQRAFFQAAFGGTPAPAGPQAAQAAATTAPAQAAHRAPAATAAEAPQKILRPGSLFDIRV